MEKGRVLMGFDGCWWVVLGWWDSVVMSFNWDREAKIQITWKMQSKFMQVSQYQLASLHHRISFGIGARMCFPARQPLAAIVSPSANFPRMSWMRFHCSLDWKEFFFPSWKKCLGKKTQGSQCLPPWLWRLNGSHSNELALEACSNLPQHAWVLQCNPVLFWLL